MKKLLLILISFSIAVLVNAQTATNFNCSDCNGVTHDLFTELDGGNVIVLFWAMPCSACISGGLTCSNVCATYPANVKFYMADDEANTACPSLASWAANNNIIPDAIFSNASIDMLDYGSSGMPKVVVIGGSNHTVFYNANNSFNPTLLQNAINQAMIIAGIEEHTNIFSSVSMYPSPANDIATVKFSIAKSSPVNIELYNMQGEKLHFVSTQAVTGDNTFDLNVSEYSSGIYLVKVTDGNKSHFTNVVVSH